MGNIQSSTSEQNPTEPKNFTCEICIEPMLLPNTLFNNGGNCVHPFCTDCMIKHIRAKLEDEIAEIPCPAFNCIQFLDPLACQGVVGPELFTRWCDLMCPMALLGFSRSYCPNRNCSVLIIDECGTKVKKAVCPKCKYPFCFQCKVPWHSGLGCKESGDENDRAFHQLAVEKNWKRCPRCHLFIEIYGGCKSVKCRHCRTYFCHGCGQEPENCRCRLEASFELGFIYFKRFIYLIIFLCLLVVFIIILRCMLKSSCKSGDFFRGKH